MNLTKRGFVLLCLFLIVVIVCLFLELIKDEETEFDNVTIIGDSRMVGLCSYTWYKNDKGTCIAEVAMGYSWFINTAINKLDELEKGKKENIVLNLGVNDLYNINNYINKYSELASGDWEDFNIFVVSINPTKGSYNKLNDEIDKFNDKISKALNKYKNVSYCDTNKYLKDNGFSTSDGLHYDGKTNKIIYEQIKRCIYDYYN